MGVKTHICQEELFFEKFSKLLDIISIILKNYYISFFVENFEILSVSPKYISPLNQSSSYPYFKKSVTKTSIFCSRARENKILFHQRNSNYPKTYLLVKIRNLLENVILREKKLFNSGLNFYEQNLIKEQAHKIWRLFFHVRETHGPK